jgi:uncharacterized membrane protein
MLGFFKKKQVPYFNVNEQALIKQAIVEAEHATSGEIRLFVEAKCKYIDPVYRAKEIFYSLHMEATQNHNGVLIYMAFKHKQFAIFGDAQIYKQMGKHVFDSQAKQLQTYLKQNLIVPGLCHTITQMGLALKEFFPASSTNKNELPDDIVFGK